jgi:hypothetical protein
MKNQVLMHVDSNDFTKDGSRYEKKNAYPQDVTEMKFKATSILGGSNKTYRFCRSFGTIA